MEEAASQRASRSRPRVDAAELERRRARGSLELARKRVLHDLETARNPRRQEMLRASLKHLDEEIARLK